MCKGLWGRLPAQGCIIIFNNSFSSILRKWGKVFPTLYCNMIMIRSTRVLKRWLESQCFELLKWPLQSRYLKLWQELERKIALYSDSPRNLGEIYASAVTG